MDIYNNSGSLLLDITPDDNSYRNRAIMEENELTLYFSLPTHIELPIGSYCSFEGETYTLMRPEQFKMQHKRLFEYTVTFSSSQASAKIWKFRNIVDGRLKFPLTAKPKEHLQMFIDNMNRRDTGWTIGECIDDVEKLISYDHDYCWDALAKMATEFETEFEVKGKTVSLRKVEYNKDNPLPLSYGRGNGFKPGIGRSNTSDTLPVEILFVQGGERNIDRSKYPPKEKEQLRAVSNGRLLLPVGATIGYDGTHFQGQEGYSEENARHYTVDDLGLSIRNTDRTPATMAEDSLDRSDDYPKRVGEISSVVEVDPAKNLYDFIDESIPADLNYEDYLIGDEKMTVIFQSGMLAGREFEVKYIHEAKTINGVQKAARRFEIVPQEVDGVMMPGGAFVPVAKDTYAVFHVMLPDAYIRNDADRSGAEWDMFRAGAKYLYENEDRKFSFTGELDGLWAKQDWVNIGGRIILGGYVRFTDENFAPDGVLVRITAIKDYVNNPHSPKITLSNDTISGSVSGTLKKLESSEVVVENNKQEIIQYTKRRFRDAKETIKMLEAAFADDFSKRINPVAVETMSMLVGDDRLQFHFVDIATGLDSNTVPHNAYWDKSTKKFHADAGSIQHLTLGINNISPVHDLQDYYYWDIAEYDSAPLDDASKSYYVYICAAKYDKLDLVGPAFFCLSNDPHLGEDEDDYYFLYGILNAEYNGERSFVTLNGFSEILPGRITTDKIISADGNTWFNLQTGEIRGNIRFTDGSSIEDVINAYDATIIEGGKIKTDLIDVGSLTAKKVEVVDNDGAGVKILPNDNGVGSVSIYNAQGKEVAVLEGGQYNALSDLFSDTIADVAVNSYKTGQASVYASSDTSDGRANHTRALSSTWHTSTPCEVFLTAGKLYCYAKAAGYTKPSTTTGITKISSASVSISISVQTYSDAECTHLVRTDTIATCSASASAGSASSGAGSYIPGAEDSGSLVCTGRSVKVPAGYHKLYLNYTMFAGRQASQASVQWGSAATGGADIASEYRCNYYVSRFFANGFCLGRRGDKYVMIWYDGENMNFAVETNGVGFKVLPTGITYRTSSTSQWKTLT